MKRGDHPITDSGHAYFAHIDGIRAVAVIPVFIYHLYATLCPGGFAGVDVFFVISGYLITSGINRELEKGSFSLRDFYCRRIRRILPAYIVLIACVFCAGIVFFYSHPLAVLGESAIASSVFISNIYFWILGGDYFGPKNLPQPLLHLWSLGVEEQFYLIVPIIFLLFGRLSKRYLLVAISLFALASMIGAIHFVITNRGHDAFFLPHLRAWELLAGSILAMMPKFTGGKRSWHPATLASLGMFMILIGYAAVSSSSLFPGATAIPFVLGTLLLIRHGNAGPVGSILTSRLAVKVGKISYSLYLWHWPIIVFWRFVTFDQLVLLDYFGIIVTSLIASYLSWRFIETPARRPGCLTSGRAYWLAFGGCAAVFTLGFILSHSKGLPSLIHHEANKLAGYRDPLSSLDGKVRGAISRVAESQFGQKNQFLLTIKKERESEIFEWGGPADVAIGVDGDREIILIGDSYAGSIQYGLDILLCANNFSGHVISQGGAPMFDLRQQAARRAMTFIASTPSIGTVVIVQNWQGYVKGYGGHFEDISGVKNALIEFSANLRKFDKELIIVECIPTHQFALNDIAARMKMRGPRVAKSEWISLHQSFETYEAEQGDINIMLREVAAETGSGCFAIQNSFRGDGGYKYFLCQGSEESPLYKDSGHLSQLGSKIAASYLYEQSVNHALRIARSKE